MNQLFKLCKSKIGYFRWQSSGLRPTDRHLGRVLDGSVKKLQLRKEFTFNCWEACLALCVGSKMLAQDNLIDMYCEARKSDAWDSEPLMNLIGFDANELSNAISDFQVRAGDYIFFGESGTMHVCMFDKDTSMVWSHWVHPVEGVYRTSLESMLRHTHGAKFMVATPSWI